MQRVVVFTATWAFVAEASQYKVEVATDNTFFYNC